MSPCAGCRRIPRLWYWPGELLHRGKEFPDYPRQSVSGASRPEGIVPPVTPCRLRRACRPPPRSAPPTESPVPPLLLAASTFPPPPPPPTSALRTLLPPPRLFFPLPPPPSSSSFSSFLLF